MSTLKSADLQNNARGNMEFYKTSQDDQPPGRSVSLPLSHDLIVDEELKLSRVDFKLSIDAFFKNKNITPLSQLTATPPFPTPYVLAQFASNAYNDYKKQETDAKYETLLTLPDGWKLLTTASNSRKTNGYFGAAYWHPENQQVVIAHRGIVAYNWGTLLTDVKGVLGNQYVSQMASASTFSYKVVEVLQEFSRLKGVSFQLFFTGHGLGGWLAQITTFTTEYLKIKGNIFLKKNNDQDCCHPHTVVFDSPGCKDMLSQMTDTFDVRLHRRSIDIEQLDITSYLSAPNRINTCNTHVGTVYRIFIDLSEMGWHQKHTALYNLTTHSMDKIVQAFDYQTGQVRKDEQGKLKVQVVVDWPISAGKMGDKEYNKFFEWARHLNNYHPDTPDEFFQDTYYKPIRYQTEVYDERVKSFRIFSREEQEFLRSYRWLRKWPQFFKPEELFCVIEDDRVQEQAEKILRNYEIENDTIQSTDASALQALIPHVKRLLQLFPEIKENTKRAVSSD